MVERRRWDTDDRFVGVADGSSVAPDLERLLAQATDTGWITEDAEAHLGPHLRAASATLGLVIERLEVVDHVLELDLRPPVGTDRGASQVALFGLIGAIAEDSTYLRHDRITHTWEVMTGVLPGDGDFTTHGHLVRIRMLGEDRS